MKKAKISYETINGKEVYAIRLYDAEFDEWSIYNAYYFNYKENDQNDEPNYLNYHIVHDIVDLISMGYEIVGITNG